ncbi:MAG: DEAD/DEAH box helicase [Opitutales bacterium]|nr:DEAD/DEAH box helicase [Opitutales bacterium]
MTAVRPDNPLIVQSDHTVLVEVDSPRYNEAREGLARFAELVKSPEHIHTYRLTPLSIWNARAAGFAEEAIVAALTGYAKYPPPETVLAQVREFSSRYGRLTLARDDGGELVLTAEDPLIARAITNRRETEGLLHPEGDRTFRVEPARRGPLKQALTRIGYPVQDLAGYSDGEPLPLRLAETTRGGAPFSLRRYQNDAAEAFYAGGGPRGGAGVVVLPCGGGKTIVGIACMARTGSSTLILATNVTAVRQWIDEILDKTDLPEEWIGEYTGSSKDIRPVTVTTYQILTYRKSREADFGHFSIFDRRDWGLVIYDEVHLLPAPVFQITASLQARRRLGLTATLVREDGREEDVFSLIGPKKYDAPWKTLEAQGWIAKARCTEIRVAMPEDLAFAYATAERRRQHRIAAENPAKLELARGILAHHPGEPALVIGSYVDQVKAVADYLGVPLLTGSTPQKTRDRLFREFREGRHRVLAVSKVANFSVDLPDAAVAVQLSGAFGSRQEEAQRLGRILRPKAHGKQAHFYTLVSHQTCEQEFALRRQLFLCEQGYTYEILHLEDGSRFDFAVSHANR